jgi:hypothetical protein
VRDGYEKLLIITKIVNIAVTHRLIIANYLKNKTFKPHPAFGTPLLIKERGKNLAVTHHFMIPNYSKKQTN